MPPQPSVSTEFLKALYESGLGTTEIAARDDVPLIQSTVHKRLTRAGVITPKPQAARGKVVTEQLSDLYRSGLTPSQIAARDDIALSYEQIRKRLIGAGVIPPKRTPEERDELVRRAADLYLQGHSLRDVIDKMNLDISAQTLRGWLKNAGFHIRRTTTQALVPIEYLIELHQQDGLNVDQIAEREEVPLTASAVRRRLKQAGAFIPSKPLPSEHEEAMVKRAIRLYTEDENSTISSVAQQVGFPYRTVRRWLHAADVIRPRGSDVSTDFLVNLHRKYRLTPMEIAERDDVPLTRMSVYLRLKNAGSFVYSGSRPYSSEEREELARRAVDLYRNSDRSIASIASELGAGRGTISKMIFDEAGEPPRSRAEGKPGPEINQRGKQGGERIKVPDHVRAEVVRRALQLQSEGKTYREIGPEVGFNPSVVSRWVRRATRQPQPWEQ